VHGRQHSVLVGQFCISFDIFHLPQGRLAGSTNKAWCTLALPHDAGTPVVTVILAFESGSDGNITVHSAESNFAYAPASGALAAPHTVVRAGLDFRFASFPDKTKVTKAFTEVALSAVVATIRAR
jgi:hypothetical protein